MSNSKTATLTFRIMPQLKKALCEAADREHRSIANMVEVLIRDYCVKNGIDICEQEERMNAATDEIEGIK
ncbi:hypothetical protein AQUSIP_17290 [Aquicella siphonis]|uniref:CopG-like ribbon-helix-helix domain-containing protein n=1 Tax=Aquicella siphonis TaxID=254247 RepID=A0A5E4PJ05_9COXI|nr:hypothetical protein [Aquicella siphonis]VVC76417.1 hypothetical protein AQUSIP_17290 [Aquicella siphonis]